MLIIFDFDDTLIDTSGSILPHIFHSLTKRLKEKFALEEENSYKELLSINTSVSSSFEAVKLFLEKKQIGFFLEEAKEVFLELPKKIALREGVAEVLKKLSLSHILALVTFGNPKIQKLKLEKCGIELSFFSKIIVTEGDKKKIYRELIKAFSVQEKETVVIGDRTIDIKPAAEMGCFTVHMKFGRGLKENPPAHFTIRELFELLPIIEQIGRTKDVNLQSSIPCHGCGSGKKSLPC